MTITKKSMYDKIEMIEKALYEKQLQLKEQYIAVNRNVVKAVEELTTKQTAQLIADIVDKVAGYGSPNIGPILAKHFESAAFMNIEFWDDLARQKIVSVLKQKVYELPDAPEFDSYFFTKEVNAPNRRQAMKNIRTIAMYALQYTFDGHSSFRSDYQYTIHYNVLLLACLYEQSKVANTVSLYKLLSLQHFKQLAQDESDDLFVYEKSIQYLQDAAFEWYQEFHGMFDVEPNTIHYRDIPQYLHLFTVQQIEALKDKYIQEKYESFESYQAADKLTLPLLKIFKNTMGDISLWSIHDATYQLEKEIILEVAEQ